MDVEKIMSKPLHHRAVLVKLNIRSWSGNVEDLASAMKLSADADADPQWVGVKKKIMAGSQLARLKEITKRLREAHKANTFPYDDNGRRMASIHFFDEYRKRLDALVEEHHNAVNALVADYESMRDDGEAHLGQLWEAGIFPTPQELRDMFRAGYDLEPLKPQPSLDWLLNQRAEEHKIREDLEKQMPDDVQDCVMDIFVKMEQLGRAHARWAKEQESEVGNIPLKKIDALCAVGRVLNLDDDPEIEAQIAAVEESVENATPKKASATEAMDSIADRMAGFLGK